MSNSETSSDIKVKYENSNGENLLEDKSNLKKNQSSDTDYYFNIIANPNKTIQRKISDSESSSDFNNIINKSSTSISSEKNKSSEKSNRKSDTSVHSRTSREKYEEININSPSQPPQNNYQSPPQNNYQSPSQNNYQSPPQNNYQPFKPTVQTQNKPNIDIIQPEIKELSPSEIRMKKIELLRKLSEIKLKGFKLSKEYDFNSSLDEMEYEYDLLKSFADKRNGVKIFKSGLLQVVSLVEFLNDKYDPFDFHLSGWSEHLSYDIESYDDVLEDLYEKYKGTGKKMAPEIRILFLIIASASAFHFTKSQSANLPGLDSLLSSNPGLLSKIINPSKNESSQFMTPQEINIEKQKADIKKNQQTQQRQSIPGKQSTSPFINKPVQPTQSEQSTQPTINQSTRLTNPVAYTAFGNNSPSTTTPRQFNIKAPDQVKNILNRIHNLEPSNIRHSNTETQDETSSNNDRIISESTLSDANSKKKMIRKPKKASISIL